MLSTTSMIIFGIIALIAVVVIWKWWKKPNTYKKNDELQQKMLHISSESLDNIQESPISTPTVYAINDNGILDLADMTGKILNIGFGKHPKTYAILLNYAENDTNKNQNGNEITTYISKVGDTKLYNIIDQPYIINYTRL